MSTRHTILFAIMLFVAILPNATIAESADSPVVVELFTSQGCSSCPPADAHLGELAKRQEVLALAFHVDYWNHIGWQDPFAAPFASERQRAYATHLSLRFVYTPQIVVNGTAEGNGSDRATIGSLISRAAAESTVRPSITLARAADGRITVRVGAAAAAIKEDGVLWLVGYDRRHTTKVLRGENGGRTLTNYNPVRSLRRIGIWKGDALDLILPVDSVSGDGGIAVLLQQGGNGRILTAARIEFPKK